MKVKELIKQLKECDQETEVEISLEDVKSNIRFYPIMFISIGGDYTPNYINAEE